MTFLNKILVIGAGIAGPAVCYWLKRFGFSPTLIEKCSDIRKGGQGLDVRGVAISIIKMMNIYEEIGERRTRIDCGRYVDKAGTLLHEEHGEQFGFRQDDEIEISRGDLVEILMKKIADVPSYFNQVVEGIHQNNNGVTVNFKDGRVEQYDLVIGADGIYSATRGMVFDKDEVKLTNLGVYLSVFTLPNYLNLNHMELVCEANQKLVTINSDTDPDTATAAFMFPSQHLLEDGRDEQKQKQFLYAAFHDFGWEVPKILEFLPESEDFYFDSATQVKMKFWTKGRVALLGDAGYCASPLSGQGNNLALVGAYILAGELKAANGNYKLAFNRYNHLLKSFIETNQKFGVWASESFLVANEISKEIASERSNKVRNMINDVANGISLPEYEG